ncbi:MAG: 4Fe-4S binding protein [Rectinema sp.]|nr:4Fe-4S binding protein [Rectinema sp.]
MNEQHTPPEYAPPQQKDFSAPAPLIRSPAASESSTESGGSLETPALFHSVQIDESLCVGCTTCIRFCPTKAIRVRNGKARISEELCIDCGECIRRCPKGAKKAVSDPLFLLDGFDIRVALPAPSLYGQFALKYSHAEIFEALHHIGFDEVLDVAWGAVEATRLTCALIDQAEALPVISSACPVVVRLIQQRFPSLIPNLFPLIPPVEIAAQEARRLLAESRGKIGVFFLSPCTAKVTAVRWPLGYEHSKVDAVFSLKDVFPSLKKALEALSPMQRQKCKAIGLDQKNRHFLPFIDDLEPGLGWARSDGELEALHIPDAVSVDGISNVIDLLEAIENSEIQSIRYIEALACPGGCVGGPMAVENPHIARSTMRQRCERLLNNKALSPAIVKSPASLSMLRKTDQDALQRYGWTIPLKPKPVRVLSADLAKALVMAEEIERTNALLPGIDCGACGAPDCQSLAEDIVRGLATIEDCLISRSHVSEQTQEHRPGTADLSDVP